jgi:hypothetical protein
MGNFYKDQSGLISGRFTNCFALRSETSELSSRSQGFNSGITDRQKSAKTGPTVMTYQRQQYLSLPSFGYNLRSDRQAHIWCYVPQYSR